MRKVNIGKRIMWANRMKGYAAWVQFLANMVTVVIVADISGPVVGCFVAGALALTYGVYLLDKGKLFEEEQREQLKPMVKVMRELLREEGVSRHGMATGADGRPSGGDFLRRTRDHHPDGTHE